MEWGWFLWYFIASLAVIAAGSSVVHAKKWKNLAWWVGVFIIVAGVWTLVYVVIDIFNDGKSASSPLELTGIFRAIGEWFITLISSVVNFIQSRAGG